MPKNAEIAALLKLHAIDTEIAKLTTQKSLLPSALRRIETQLSQQRQSVEEKRARIKVLRTRIHAREVDLRAAEADIQKLTTQLNTAKTNKEYTAFQHEIANKKTDASRIEDDLLAMMGDAEELEGDARELERTIAQIEKQHGKEDEGVRKDTGALDAKLEKLKNERHAASGAVSAPLLQEYERMAAKKGPSALAPVVGNSCQGCFMELPPQVSHMVRGGRKVVKCPNCSRLLYMP